MNIRYCLLGQVIERNQLKGLSGIYEIVSKNGEYRYVGSSKTLLSRVQNHISSAKRNTHHNKYFQSVFVKYGIDYINILEIVSEEMLEDRENYYIKLFGFENLTNLLPTAYICPSTKTEMVYEISMTSSNIIKKYESLAKAVLEKSRSIESAMSNPNRKSHGSRWCYVKDYPKLKNIFDECVPNRTGKYIYKIDPKENIIIDKYNNAVDASREFQGFRAVILFAVNKPHRTAYGYRWCHSDKYEELKESFDISPKGRTRKIKQIDAATNNVINEFDSITQAAIELNYSYDGIHRVLRGERPKYKKCFWSYS